MIPFHDLTKFRDCRIGILGNLLLLFEPEKADAWYGPFNDVNVVPAERRALTNGSMPRARVHELRIEMERAEAQRLQPHHVQSFFVEAFKQLGGQIKRREEGRWEINHVPMSIRERDRQIGSGAPIQKKYERICFEKSKIHQQPVAAFVCPETGQTLQRSLSAHSFRSCNKTSKDRSPAPKRTQGDRCEFAIADISCVGRELVRCGTERPYGATAFSRTALCLQNTKAFALDKGCQHHTMMLVWGTVAGRRHVRCR